MSGRDTIGKIKCMPGVAGVSGLTMTELLVVIALIGILASVAAPQLGSTVRHLSVKRCAEQIASDIKLARATAMAQGQRAVVAITNNSPFNLGYDTAYELAFIDANRNGVYDSGDTLIVSQSSCDSSVVMQTQSNPPTPPGQHALPNCQNISNASCLWFSSLGTINTASANTNIMLANVSDSNYLVRINIASLTGYLQVQWCQPLSVNCNIDTNWKSF